MAKLNRRTFVRTGIGTAGLVGVGATSCQPAGEPLSGEADAPVGREFEVPPFFLDEITIDGLAEKLRSGELTCRRVAELYLDRIETLNQRGPRLFAILETNPDALEIADSLDRERRAGGTLGPLHGIPILLKDNIDTADGMTTTGGSTALEGSVAPRDAFVAQRLHSAGALLLGKTNMSEWAGWKSFERGVPGWSGRGWEGGKGGLCCNPYILDRVTGGSSSGSGVAAAANLAVATIGSETDGSIVGPSSRNCLVGIKPTIGLVSRAGVIPISRTQDSTGPMARTVRDAAIVLGALTGIDPRDPATAASAGKTPTDYLSALDPQGLLGARVGVARDYAGFDDRVDRLLEEALDAMRSAGATIVDPVVLPSALRFANEFEMEVLYHEFKAGLNEYLAALGPQAPIRSLAELIQYNQQHFELELALAGQELLERSQERGPLTDAVYLSALASSRRLSRTEGIDKTMEEHALDAIVAPASGIPSMLDPTGASGGGGGGCSTPSAMAGYPNLSVPMGFVYGLPIGLDFFGRAWSETTLIKLAFAYEQLTNHRRPPQFQATVDVTRPWHD